MLVFASKMLGAFPSIVLGYPEVHARPLPPYTFGENGSLATRMPCSARCASRRASKTSAFCFAAKSNAWRNVSVRTSAEAVAQQERRIMTRIQELMVGATEKMSLAYGAAVDKIKGFRIDTPQSYPWVHWPHRGSGRTVPLLVCPSDGARC